MMRWAAVLLLALTPVLARGGETASVNASDDRLDAGEADFAQPKEKESPWNEANLGFMTARLGGGFLYDTAAYAQNDVSNQQLNLSATSKLRDFRLLLKGRFPDIPRLSYTIGYMYDGPTEVWRFRQTGLMVDFPEVDGSLFIGRTKEGFSTSKMMVGYHGWTHERSAANDSFLPILADGVKWTGGLAGGQMIYSLGAFVGSLTNQPYAKNDSVYTGRAVWLPLASRARPEEPRLLHVAAQVRYGSSLNGTLQFKSKPESFPAQQNAVDTGKIPASGHTMLGFEAYDRPGPLMFGSEYYLNTVFSNDSGTLFFHGGELFAAWLVTGETRPYNTRGGFFEAVSPGRSVFSGGPGAWELVLRGSYVDLDSKVIQGGRFWRFTPMVNWHLSDNARFEFVYGYGILDRFGLQGGTWFFQTRLQLTLM